MWRNQTLQQEPRWLSTPSVATRATNKQLHFRHLSSSLFCRLCALPTPAGNTRLFYLIPRVPFSYRPCRSATFICRPTARGSIPLRLHAFPTSKPGHSLRYPITADKLYLRSSYLPGLAVPRTASTVSLARQFPVAFPLRDPPPSTSPSCPIPRASITCRRTSTRGR